MGSGEGDAEGVGLLVGGVVGEGEGGGVRVGGTASVAVGDSVGVVLQDASSTRAMASQKRRRITYGLL